ncbi:MAG: LytTR family transcriptional regulator DNA-binding domain-containing protein [Prevotellaceae bacterium]|nr:LytTR family transcriptional regulator DNA-binding domain-containing protein [Candidatus Minthosoma equi]
MTAFLLYVVNHLFLPLEVNLTVPGYPEFLPSFAFYCSIVFRYCIIFFVIDVLVYRHRKMKHEFDEICAINEMLKSYQEDRAFTSAVESEKKGDSISVKVGQNSNQELVFNPESLIYVESVGNYAEVCYLCNQEIKKISFRSTLKQVNESLSTYVSIIQCHRGFIVNLNYVETLQCENNSYFLNLFYVDKKIPVSRTKKADIKAALSALQR